MSAERDIINTTQQPVNIRDLPPEQRRARIASVLDRGLVGTRLHVDLPPGVYGEWAANDPESIFRMQTLGFEIDTQYAKTRALHTDGTDKSIVGDVIFMTCPQSVKDEIEEVRNLRYAEQHSKKRDLPEESNVLNKMKNEGLPVFNDSLRENAGAGQIRDVVSK